MAAEDYYNPKTSKGTSCSAREYAIRCMRTVNYHDSKACKVQSRRASARRASIARKRDVLAKVGEVDDLSLREDLIHSVLLPPHEAKSRGLDGGKWEDVYGPAAAWWSMEFWHCGNFRGYRREVDGAFIPYYYERNCPPRWYYESDDDDEPDAIIYKWDDYAAACALKGHVDDAKWRSHLERIIVRARAALTIGLEIGWLARAKALQMWRDRGEIIGDEPDPCPPC